MVKLKEFLFGGKDEVKQLPTLTPEQQKLIALIEEGLTKGTGDLAGIFGDFDQESFDEGVTQPALKNFQDNILPMLTEQFIGNNQVLGSSLQNAKLKAGNDLQSKLAQLMYQAKQGQQQNKLAGINNILGTKGFENVYKQGNQGAIPGLLQGFGQGAGQAAGSIIAG